ncbi:hypothetical protein MRB53_009115 [Persea americana]|uniref:Uncharacterized protein n=1 Tax=Persea americana TaxID=3435 RepID=A0ACC2LNS1_PERAE|nr:hypothetical protein MRB53_009115 [Persea americana]
MKDFLRFSILKEWGDGSTLSLRRNECSVRAALTHVHASWAPRESEEIGSRGYGKVYSGLLRGLVVALGETREDNQRVEEEGCYSVDPDVSDAKSGGGEMTLREGQFG